MSPGDKNEKGETLIEVITFKDSGKYYTSERYWSAGTHMGDWCDEVEKMREERRLPGLVEGAQFDLFVIDAGFPQILDLREAEAKSRRRAELAADRLPMVYIAGPFTKVDPVQNTGRAIDTFVRLSEICVPFVPHLSLFIHMHHPRPWAEWLEYDLQVLARCDAVYRMWGESKGADMEVARAEELGIPVFNAGEPGQMLLREFCREFIERRKAAAKEAP